MNGYYRIDSKRTQYGKFELWESEKYGEERPCKVTLDGEYVGCTFDDLNTFIEDEF